MREKIYLDYNATTPLAPEVLEAIVDSLKNDWANPSSSYELGEKSKRSIEQARNVVAEMLGTTANDIIFTSGGTEANNLVIHSTIEHFNKTLASSGVDTTSLPHIITSNVEHDATILPLQHLKSLGAIDLTVVPVSKLTGSVSVADVIAALRLNTCLVTIMLANNETGVLNPIEEICAETKLWVGKNKKHLLGNVFFHTDAAQAIGKIQVNVMNLGVDYLTVVGHKFYGPRNGAIYVRGLGKECPLFPQIRGGGQERGYRAGTENTPMIVGLGKAAELVIKNLAHYTKHMSEIKVYFESEMKKFFKDEINFNNHFPSIESLPNTVNVSFLGKGLQGYAMLSECRLIMASVGAACHSQNKPSSILLASGIPEEIACNAIRFSFGRDTLKKEIDEAIIYLGQALQTLKSKSELSL